MKPKILQQGAEAKIFLDEKNNLIIKDRISKSYRHPELDKQIRKRRTRSETKLLQKAHQLISSPLPISPSSKMPNSLTTLKKSERGNERAKVFSSGGGGDAVEYTIKMPFINGQKLSEHLDKFQLKKQKQIMRLIGDSVAKLHKADIIHGDLTTSNMILVEDKILIVEQNIKKSSLDLTESERRNLTKSASEQNKSASKASIYFIDFGLGFISKKIEDKAVDIHLLKQAFEAKHFKNWKTLFREFEKLYSKNNSESKNIFERITAVEKRGRYRH